MLKQADAAIYRFTFLGFAFLLKGFTSFTDMV